MTKKRILTGDRPTGKLHLGHYVGTLKNRVKLQSEYECFFIIADLHMLTTEIEKEKLKEISKNTRELILDYLSVGIDPEKCVIYQQSKLPEVAYLSLLFSMLVSVPRCQRVPTLKDVMKGLKIEKPSLGLLTYPVLQAADILMVKSHLVPVGKDQESHIELTREIASRFNSLYKEIFPVPKVLIGGETLCGIDGKTKMSKSLGNCIYLSDSKEQVKNKIMKMYTDPKRIHKNDPGEVKGNPVFIYHDAFNKNKEEVKDLRQRYKIGKVGDVEVKEKLAIAINKFLDPIRKRRKIYESDKDLVEKILEKGNKLARAEAQKTLKEVLKAMGLF
ncbi:tryptophan--tRNA ligase [Patescibacteria group bacterium]|nr:tryptophan--tRNA ligase [Patescibacteria group bacterium]